jgi:hypothetical protein
MNKEQLVLSHQLRGQKLRKVKSLVHSDTHGLCSHLVRLHHVKLPLVHYDVLSGLVLFLEVY